MSRPSGKIGRDTSSLENTCSSVTFCRPAAIASSVLPVPALPTSVTSLTSSFSRRSSAKCCSLLRGLIPPHAVAQLLDGHGLAAVLVPPRERRLRTRAALVLERQVLVRV